jgi:hypothetical protein
MSRSASALCFTLLPYLCFGGAVACGGGHGDGGKSPSEGPADAGTAPAADPPPELLLEPSGGPEAAPPDAGCLPEAGTDEPDDEFSDTNCDGIDGDASSAVFVAPTGSDADPGTMNAPVRTLGKGIDKAAAGGKAVYVCDAEYAENVKLDHVAVSLYGGYDCANGWRRLRDHAIVKPPSGLPLVIDGADALVVVDRMAFRAADAVTHSESSIAASVHDSKNVRFVHTEFTAGNGADGQDGGAVAFLVTLPETAGFGESAIHAESCGTLGRGDGVGEGDPVACSSLPAGGHGTLVICPDGLPVIGGRGGRGGNFALGIPAEEGSAGFPTADLPYGTPGTIGTPGKPGAAFGTIKGGLYRATNVGLGGGAGRAGYPGHGGAGGDSYGGGSPMLHYPVGGGGGQGGYSGCGGYGGLPGTGAGGSIAIVVDGSGVTLERSTFTTARGGRGGNGGDGGGGARGAAGGLGGKGSLPLADGHPGGAGGDGGQGGAGGPGGGGPSVAVAFRGLPPSITAPSYSLGEPGPGGTSLVATASSGMSAERYGVDSPADAGK